MGTVATTYYPTNINVPRFDWASTAQLPQNLLTYSNDFTNAAWQKASITTSYGVTGPTGAADATTITAGANNVYMYQSAARTNAGSTTYTASIWVRRRTGTGLIQIIAPNGSTATTIAPTSDWTRFSVTGLGNSNGTTYAPQVYIGTSGDALDVYGGQLEVGTSTTEYKQTGAFTPTNTPLLPASTCNGLLIEESRANRILWCRDASQSNWTKTNVTAAKDQTGIDGVANAASSLTATADNGTCIQTITLASGSRTASVYLKRITGTGNVQVSLDGSTWSTVDLSSTEWRRIVLSGTVTNPVVGIRLATNGDAVAMDFAQVEDGAFATTPILTTTASATRAVDAVSTRQPVLFATDNCTIFARSQSFDTGNYGILRMGASGTQFPLNFGADGLFMRFSNNAQQSLTVATPQTTQKISVAGAYNKNNYLYTDSGKPATERNYITIAANNGDMLIGFDNNLGYLNGWIDRISFLPKQLNAQVLQNLTGQAT
jgi:hypothetical protein